MAEIREGRVETAADLSRALIAASGVEQLGDLLTEHFARRARSLKARSVVAGLKDVARRLAPDDQEAGGALLAAVEEFESTSNELSDLRLWYLAISGNVEFDEDDLQEIRRLTSEGSVTARLGIDGGSTDSKVGATVLRRIEYWRARAAIPLSGRAFEEACEIIARSYEGLYMETTGRRDQ